MKTLRKDLNLFGLTMVAVGSVIGSGIFLTPSQIATYIPHSGLILLAWVFGGILALTGALTLGELGGMFPKTGGIYVYLKEGYGDYVGFLYGWAYFTVIMSGTVAALSIAFATYLGYLFPMGATGKVIVSSVVIIIVTVINIFRVKIVEMTTNTFSLLKLAGITIIIIIGLSMGLSSNMMQGGDVSTSDTSGFSGITAFGLAMIGVLWSFGGWHHTSFLAGEAKDSNRTIPRAMVYGTLIVLLVYILTNMAYMFLMPVNEIAQSESLAADALASVLPIGGLLVAILIAVSTFGTALVDTLSGPRIYYAMANDGLFFRKLTKIHAKYNTPVNSIIAQSIWALIILFMWRTFEAVITYVTFIDWIFFFLTALIVVMFRIKRKQAHRPFKTPWYPLVPVIFIVTSFLFVLNTLAENILYAGAGLGLLALGTPVYFFFKRRKQKVNG